MNLIVAEQEFDIARDQLATLTGRKWETLAELRDDLPMEGPQPSKMNAWIDKAAYQNPQILAARYSAKAAGFTADRQLGAMLPKVQLFAEYQHNHNTDPSVSGGDPGNQLTQFYSTQPDTNSKTIGIEVTVPLFRGGGLNSQRKQAALLTDAAGQRYQQTIRDISQQARTFYRSEIHLHSVVGCRRCTDLRHAGNARHQDIVRRGLGQRVGAEGQRQARGAPGAHVHNPAVLLVRHAGTYARTSIMRGKRWKTCIHIGYR